MSNAYGYTTNPVSVSGDALSNGLKVQSLADADLVLGLGASNVVIKVGALTGARAITLPPVAQSAGRIVNVVCTATIGQVLTITGPAAGSIVGRCQQKGASAADSYTDFVSSAGSASLALAATAVKGDRVNMYCDGAEWVVDGYSSVVTNATPTFAFA